MCKFLASPIHLIQVRRPKVDFDLVMVMMIMVTMTMLTYLLTGRHFLAKSAVFAAVHNPA